MKLEIDYVKEIYLEEPKELKTKSGKEFYSRKINIKSDTGLLTIIVKGFTKDNVGLIPTKTLEEKEEKPINKKSKKKQI